MAQSKVPKFGSWENGEVAYTAYFEVARKGNNGGGPLINPNDAPMNREVTPLAPSHTKPDPKQQQQQAKFGEWDNGDSVPYTQIFENKGRTANPNEPQMNRDVGATKQNPKPPQKQQQQQHQPPKFGAWEGAEEVPYTQIFENKGKQQQIPKTNTNTNTKEPQMNRDVGPTRETQEPRANKPQGVKFVDNKPKQGPPAAPRPQGGRGGGASVPVFGGWNHDSTQAAAGYTVVFEKLHDDKKNVNNVPPRNNNNHGHIPQTHNNNKRTPTRPIKQQHQQQKQGGCFSWLLG